MPRSYQSGDIAVFVVKYVLQAVLFVGGIVFSTFNPVQRIVKIIILFKTIIRIIGAPTGAANIPVIQGVRSLVVTDLKTKQVAFPGCLRR
jgi:hypothetical protein